MRLAFNDELFSFSVQNEDENSRVLCARHRLNRENYDLGASHSFDLPPPVESVLRLPGAGNIQVKCVKVVNESSTGLMRPCVVLGPALSMRGRQELEFHIGMIVDDVFKTSKRFKVSSNPDLQVALLDGPNVCVLDGHKISFTHNENRHGYLLMKALSVCEDDGVLAKYELLCAVLKSETLIGLVRSDQFESMDTDECDQIENPKLYAFHYRLDEGMWSAQKIRSEWLIPNIYGSVLGCVHIIKVKYDDSSTGQGSNRFSSRILLGTSRGQVLHFENGKLHDCVTLQGSDLIQLSYWCDGPHESAAVLTKQGCLYTINLETFQVTNQFSSVADMFLGDFLHLGSDQLLLTNASDRHNLSQIIVTDGLVTWINTFDQVSSDDQVTPSTGGDENNNMTVSAISALQGRLQNGIHQLWEAEREANMREKVAIETFHALQSMSLNMTPSYNASKVGLVNLLGEKSSPSDAGGRRHGGGDYTSETTCTIHVTDRWQRVIDEHWIIGVHIINKTKETICDVNLLLVPEADSASEMECTSFLMSGTAGISMSSMTEDAPKKRKVNEADSVPSSSPSAEDEHRPVSVKCISCLSHDDAAFVTMVTKLPSFGFARKRDVEMILQWQVMNDDGRKDVRQTRKRELPKSIGKGDVAVSLLPVGCISLTSEDVLCGHHGITLQDEDTQALLYDLISLSAYQCPVNLMFTSVLSSLHMIPGQLTKAGFMYNQTLDHWLHTTVGPLHLVRLNVKILDQHSAHVILHARDDSQLYLALHAMYGVIADDVTINPHRQDSEREDIEHALHALIDEISYLHSSCRDMITNSATLPDQQSELEILKMDSKPTNVKELEQVRSEFEKRQRKIRENNRGIISSTVVGRMRNQLVQKQIETNAHMQQLTAT